MKLSEISQKSGVAFGTSGARGLVSSMVDKVCGAYTQAFLQAVAADAAEVVLGHDLRPSSLAIAAACAQSIRAAGKNVVFVGALPTPAIAYYAALRQAPAIIVTGSHIPFDRNGIKFYRAEGEITKADEAAMLETEVQLPDDGVPARLPEADPAAEAAYISRYVDAFGPGALKGKRVALYEHSSVARDVLRTLLHAMGAEVLSLGRTDTFVPIDTEAVRPEDVALAREWAQAHRFDAIISTDGDADRPLIGDETGAWLRGDVVGVLCAQILGADVVVTPVSSNTIVEKCGSFRTVTRTRIGSPYVIAGMQTAAQTSSPGTTVVGYEANGGFLLGTDVDVGQHFLKALPTRDAVLPVLALLVASVQRGVSFSKLAASLPARHTASDRIQEVPTEASRALISSLHEDVASACGWLVPDAGRVVLQDETDGLRLTFATGEVVHLRPSGNAPELRCYTEADTPERATALCADTLRRVALRIGKSDSAS